MSKKRRARDLPPFEAVLEDFDDQGRAVARVDGKVVFIAGALPGERVRARYLALRRRFDEAEVLEVLEAHPHRVEPRCPHHDMCGGCVLQHLDHAEQVRMKQGRLLENLARLGSVEPGRLLDPLVAEPWGYRTRARLGVKYVPAKGGALVGFRERSGHRLADIHRCDVLDPRVGERIDTLRSAMGDMDCRRRMPQIEVSLGDDAGALAFRHLDPLTDDDRERFAGVASATGLDVDLQSGGPDTLAGLDGGPAAELAYRLDDHDLTMRFGAADFTQVNPAINRAMLAQALDLLDPGAFESVLDLFCGIGNFTLPIARRTTRVTGVEGSERAVERARANADANGIDNATFAAGDLFDEAVAAEWVGQGFEALLLDPPRSGAQAVVSALRAPLPARIVYVSCSPATLARDAGVLCNEHGYRLEAAGIVDMFPHTNHVESMALFERS